MMQIHKCSNVCGQEHASRPSRSDVLDERAITRYEWRLGEAIEPDKKQHQQDEPSPPQRFCTFVEG